LFKKPVLAEYVFGLLVVLEQFVEQILFDHSPSFECGYHSTEL
jgi:hypothetical protein